jgi:D-glycero-D-manno-heptose 1,7-bisphosphate phosphatase
MKRALFLDRDGTLIVDTGYPNDPKQVFLIEAAVPVLHAARACGYSLVVVSNQSGVARGRITKSEAEAVDARFQALFAAHGIDFDAILYCFHGPDDACLCRKPKPGMLQLGSERLSLALDKSIMVGDKPSDCEAGRAVGTFTFLLTDGSTAASADAAVADTSGTWAEVLIHIERTIV